MHDEPWQPHFTFDEPRYSSLDDRDRVVHLVHLDGLLVDAWSEPVEGTRYADIARRIDRERRPISVPEAPKPPLHLQLTSWLQGLVGGAHALAELNSAPLVPLDPIDLEPLPLGIRHRLEGVLTLLRGVPQLDPSSGPRSAYPCRCPVRDDGSPPCSSVPPACWARGPTAWAVLTWSASAARRC